MGTTVAKAVVVTKPTARPRSWIRRLLAGGQMPEQCTSWCTDSHRGDDVSTSLDELQHGRNLPGVVVDVDDAQGGSAPLPILAPRLAVDPYSEDPARNTPHILLEVAPDEFTQALSPSEFAAVIRKLRGHLDALETTAMELFGAALAEHEARR
jgi:hypothetical protein